MTETESRPESMIKFIELFAGIGGFRYGLEKAGEFIQSGDQVGNMGQGRAFHCVYANEWDKYAAAIYERNFSSYSQLIPKEFKDSKGGNRTLNKDRSDGLLSGYEQCSSHRIDTRDIRTVDANDIPDHDLLVGGFPCQTFSIAGKRAGFEDTRGTLFFEIARILKAKRPRYCLLENVKGLLSHDRGRTFQIILQTLNELGYDLQWQVLNSKNYGVPQNRERVFIIGHLRGTSRPEVFPIRESNQLLNGEDCPDKRPPQATNSRTLRSGVLRADDTIIAVKDNISTAIDANYYKGQDNHGQRTQVIIEDFYPDRVRTFKDCPTLRGDRQGLKVIGTLNSETYLKRNESNRRIYSTDGIAPTIPAASGGGITPKIMMNTLTEATGNRVGSSKEFLKSVDNIRKTTGQIRRLTPTECERLQGFPDGWTEGISDTQRYKCLGNAVTTNVITAIGKKLLKPQ